MASISFKTSLITVEYIKFYTEAREPTLVKKPTPVFVWLKYWHIFNHYWEFIDTLKIHGF